MPWFHIAPPLLVALLFTNSALLALRLKEAVVPLLAIAPPLPSAVGREEAAALLPSKRITSTFALVLVSTLLNIAPPRPASLFLKENKLPCAPVSVLTELLLSSIAPPNLEAMLSEKIKLAPFSAVKFNVLPEQLDIPPQP